jgi:hypothetical protein
MMPPLSDNEKENYQTLYSPDGREVAFIENRMTLKILHLESKQTRTLLTDKELFSNRDCDQYFQRALHFPGAEADSASLHPRASTRAVSRPGVEAITSKGPLLPGPHFSPDSM